MFLPTGLVSNNVRTNRTFNDYQASDIRLCEIVAVGGYGTVFKGEIKQSRKIVAMKTLLSTRYKSKEEYDQQFDKEVVNYDYATRCPHIFRKLILHSLSCIS